MMIEAWHSPGELVKITKDNTAFDGLIWLQPNAGELDLVANRWYLAYSILLTFHLR
jgi:hypothetical protein